MKRYGLPIPFIADLVRVQGRETLNRATQMYRIDEGRVIGAIVKSARWIVTGDMTSGQK